MKRTRFPSIDTATPQNSKYESPQKKSRQTYLLEDDDAKRIFSYTKYYDNGCSNDVDDDGVAFRFSIAPHSADHKKPKLLKHQKQHCNRLILLLANVLMVVSGHFEGGQASERLALFQAKNHKQISLHSARAELTERDLLEYIQKSSKFVTGAKLPMDMWKLELGCSVFEWFSSTQSTKYFNELVEYLKPSLEVCIHHGSQSLCDLYSKLSTPVDVVLTPRKRRFAMFGRIREDERKQSKRFVLNLDEEGQYCSLWAVLSSVDGSLQIFELCCGLVNLQSNFNDRDLLECEHMFRSRLNGEALAWRMVVKVNSGFRVEYQRNQQTKQVSFHDWNFMECDKIFTSLTPRLSEEETDAIVMPVLSDLEQEAKDLLKLENETEDVTTKAIESIIQKLGHLDHLIQKKCLNLTATHQETINKVQEAGCTVLVRVLTSMTEITPSTHTHLESIRALVNSSARLQTVNVHKVLVQAEETLGRNSNQLQT